MSLTALSTRSKALASVALVGSVPTATFNPSIRPPSSTRAMTNAKLAPDVRTNGNTASAKGNRTAGCTGRASLEIAKAAEL